MSLSREEMLDLMQYADGELTGEAASRVEALLRANEEARRVVDAMGELGDVVRDGVEDRAAGMTIADGIADRVMAEVQKPQAASNVMPMEARRRGGAAAAVVAVFALAAGALLLLKSSGQSSPLAREAPLETATQAPATVAPPAPAPLATAVAQVEATPGIDLEEAHSTKNKLDVFFVPSAEGAGSAASVVVWIDDHHGGP